MQLLERRRDAADRSAVARSRKIAEQAAEYEKLDADFNELFNEKKKLEEEGKAKDRRIRSLEEELEHYKTGVRDT